VITPERIAFLRNGNHGPGIADLLDELAALQKQLKHYEWRPISQIHEDYGPCVLMDIEDPGYLEVSSNLDTDLDESQWTHFAEVPKLTNEQADDLLAAMAVAERVPE